MKKVTILALEETIASTVTGPLDILGQAGVLWNLIQGRDPVPRFTVEVASVSGGSVRCMSGLRIQADCAINDVAHTDLVVISAEHLGVLDEARTQVVPWLKHHWEAGAHLASVCTGAFLLAETGLLDGRRATTHWGFAAEFRRRFPQVDLRPECLVTDEGRLLCGGGAYSYIDLSLHLVEKFAGFEEASHCAQSLLLDMRRASQLDYAVFAFQKGHGDPDILKAQAWIEDRFQDPVTVEEVAEAIAMSPRNLKRRFKKATGDSPLAYVQRVRVEAAKRALACRELGIEEVAVRSGYEDSGFFRQLFRRHTGMTPSDYRRRLSGAGASGADPRVP